MSEQVLSSESQGTVKSAPETPTVEDKESDRPLSQPIAEFLGVIQQTPREYWPNLLQMMRLFMETVTVKPVLSEPPQTSEKIDITKLSLEERIQRNQGAIELLRSWREEDDEQDQKETAEYLEQVINEDRMSNRPLFQ
ncbi:hypothetical protein [Microcoleus asticus]|uniref:RuBisCO chaperone RbcX n=1 Tax=Microcoleus asticus IPMA8 TaxID=2563858 RepID=A0ABX2CZS4_9CYAN|nr:hypothetical protein [Microcoleus asticus]NQE35904.1 hypothetical protein [Microcoleus asticus IPMA8]